MASNLRAKIPEGDKLVISDRNAEATTRFVQEVGVAAASSGAPGKGVIEVVKTPREVAEQSVSHCHVLDVSRSSGLDPVMSMFYL